MTKRPPYTEEEKELIQKHFEREKQRDPEVNLLLDISGEDADWLHGPPPADDGETAAGGNVAPKESDDA